uniref:HTH psq-type domain-containing protein n=1 Tax=Rhodnius prolixus TaxID=13249 RepID=T1HZY6_RHOPR
MIERDVTLAGTLIGTMVGNKRVGTLDRRRRRLGNRIIQQIGYMMPKDVKSMIKQALQKLQADCNNSKGSFLQVKMPRSKIGRKRPPVNSNAIEEAMSAVTTNSENKISLREACKIYKVSLATLSRHLKVFKESGAENFKYSTNYTVKRVFDDTEELSLVDYIKTIAKMQYGLSKKGVRELAYKYAVAKKKKIQQHGAMKKLLVKNGCVDS